MSFIITLIVSVPVRLEDAIDNWFSQTIKEIMSEIEAIMANHHGGTVCPLVEMKEIWIALQIYSK